jgi:hypothetical protein
MNQLGSKTDLQNLVQLLLILHHYDVGLAVQGHEMAGLSIVGGVDASGKTPRA